MAAPRRAAGPRALPLAVAALTFTQLAGWGMSFHVPAALYNQLSAGIGLSKAVVFGGVTLMLIVAALIAPLAGRLMDRDGARRWMTIGSLLIAGGLIVLSRADGLALYGLAWILFGLAMPFALNQGASTAIVQIAPDRARRAIAMLLVLIGFSPAIAWPTLLWLESLFGWRDALLVCATVHGLVCASLHFFCLPKGRVLADHPLVPSDAVAPRQAPVVARGTFALAATCFSAAGILSFGLPLHMIGLLQGYGHGAAEAVAIGALIGPGQVLARAFDMFGGSRFPILRVGLAATLLMPAALVVLLIWGQGGWGAMLFVFGYGVSAGLMSVVRAVAPIKLFGSAAYAVITGKLGLPQNMAFAAAPLGFALLLDHVGAPSVALASLAVAAICLASMVWLRRLAPSDGEA
ncbi:MFS transporter [Enterovirga rhinocerotis]|uniref:Putative MFS family arabinose efflux permease n=1 Tax=Enterovirga rhinocerotis TaxID=1339210 RepID=A0A4R7C5G3_9HYPH|nr:MFS transporter [Enterovirga rhinocerotis]TDR93618.1 putative MFS family arabinose efflux permease [Enterovirga rhinocerotis]